MINNLDNIVDNRKKEKNVKVPERKRRNMYR
jgi:hypothetical protein